MEILGADLDLAFQELGIHAYKTYEAKELWREYQEKYQVWELTNEDHQKICDIDEKDWKDEWGWWRSADGSNLGAVSRRYDIHGHYIKAWDGMAREGERDWYQDRKYSHLTQYFCDEIGASTEKNVCALATDLAFQNGITMAELFRKYQG